MRCLADDPVLPDFLPGRFLLERGSASDYRALASFHYIRGAPATWAGIWVVRFVPHAPTAVQAQPHPPAARTVAVGVLSYPVPSCRPRQRWFGLEARRAGNLAFVNAHIRTISRIIVHPQFRALGLSTALVRCLCRHCPTRYVEALAMMGHIHPLFERAGMTRTNPGRWDEPAHYVLDRHAPAQESSLPACA